MKRTENIYIQTKQLSTNKENAIRTIVMGQR